MSNKTKGIRFEREVKKYFKSKGCFVIRQSASQFPDLIVIYPLSDNTRRKRFYAVECKIDGKLSKTEKQKMVDLYHKYGLIPILAHRVQGKGVYFKVI